MDDTLYGASRGMFDEIHEHMLHYVMDYLHLDAIKADALRIRYWKDYGVTYYGLWLHHGIDPHHFLKVTHDVDMSIIKAQPQLTKVLQRLPGKKALFTNGPKNFADQILKRLTIGACFDRRFCAEQMRVNSRWHPKPSAVMLRNVLAQLKVPASEVCLVDDNPRNLKAAKDVGIQTVLFQGWHRQEKSRLPQREWIDASVSSLTQLEQILRKSPQNSSPRMPAPCFLNPFA